MSPKDFLVEYLIITLSFKAIAKKLLLPNGPVKMLVSSSLDLTSFS